MTSYTYVPEWVIKTIGKWFAPWKRKILSMVGRGIVKLVSDTGEFQKIQIESRTQLISNLERMQQYGITAKPHEGAEALVVCIGGDQDNGVIIAVDDRRYRVKGLADGEVCFYTDEDENDNKHRIHFKRNREIVVYCDNATVNADTDAAVTAGNDATVNAGNDATVAATNNAKLSGQNYAQVEAVTGLVLLGTIGGMKKVVLDGDPVVGGVVVSSANKVFAK